MTYFFDGRSPPSMTPNRRRIRAYLRDVARVGEERPQRRPTARPRREVADHDRHRQRGQRVPVGPAPRSPPPATRAGPPPGSAPGHGEVVDQSCTGWRPKMRANATNNATTPRTRSRRRTGWARNRGARDTPAMTRLAAIPAAKNTPSCAAAPAPARRATHEPETDGAQHEADEVEVHEQRRERLPRSPVKKRGPIARRPR